MISKDRANSKRVILYGVHPVTETLVAGKRRVHAIFFAREDAVFAELRRIISLGGGHAATIGTHELTRLCGSPHHQGVAAEVDPYPYCDLQDIIGVDTGVAACILALDQVQDPFNLGSIIRSAECLGAAGIVLTKNNSCAVTPAVEKTSAGATAHMRIARVVNMARAMDEIKSAGFWVYGMDSRAAGNLYSLNLADKAAFVMGGEGSGLRRLVRERCDMTVSIPMQGRISSLNVSHAAAIALSEFQKRVLVGGAS
ncbi:MAG: 23S rRNA (guanosine(2251)-2'-O)-methyltransferase RlmB [Desulfomonilaceae bacterium]